MVAGFLHRLFNGSNPLDFTSRWNHLRDYLAGAASDKALIHSVVCSWPLNYGE